MQKPLMCIVFILCASPAFAETIHLTDGRSVTGTITDREAKSVQIEVNGLPMTYFADEIKDIDGTPLNAGAKSPSAQAPSTSPAAPSADTAGKRDLILKFIDVFGTRAAMTQNLDAMMKALPDGPEKDKLTGSIKVDEIIDRLIPVYDKQFTEEDLRSYIDFYSSPKGKKLVSSIAAIMRDSVAISTQYFQEKFPELKSEDK